MILANMRHHLTREDAELVARLIAHDSGTELCIVERQLADHGIDDVLDDPRLPIARLPSRQDGGASLSLFAYVVVRHALRRLGEEDRTLADHIEPRRWRRGGSDLDCSEEMGRSGSRLAADHRMAEDHGLAMLYATAAERFGLLRAALNDVSDAPVFPQRYSADRLVRQVTNEARWRKMN